jgi:hypothetical protein
METLTTTRDLISEVLSEIDGLTVRPRMPPKAPKPGDGWVTISRMSPADFTASKVTFVTVIVLGADSVSADALLEEWSIDIIDAVTKTSSLYTTDVELEPITLVTEGGGATYALTLTMTTEVEAE